MAEVYASLEPMTLRLAKRTRIEPLSETVLSFNCDLAGICRVQSNLRTDKRHGLTMANGIVGLRAGGSSLLVMANYRRKAVTLPNVSILGIAELYEGDILTPDKEGQVEPLEVLAVAETTELQQPDAGKPNQSPAPADIPPKDQEALKSLAEADLDHLPPPVAEGVRRMLRKHDVMWTGGALGTIGAT